MGIGVSMFTGYSQVFHGVRGWETSRTKNHTLGFRGALVSAPEGLRSTCHTVSDHGTAVLHGPRSNPVSQRDKSPGRNPDGLPHSASWLRGRNALDLIADRTQGEKWRPGTRRRRPRKLIRYSAVSKAARPLSQTGPLPAQLRVRAVDLCETPPASAIRPSGRPADRRRTRSAGRSLD